MNLKNAVITEISSAFTVYSPRGNDRRIQNRKCYGISFCADGQITYIHKGKEYVSNRDTAIILPKGESYFIRSDKTGYFPVINFDTKDFLCDTVAAIPTNNTARLIADYEKIKKHICFESSHAQIFSIFYGILNMLTDDNAPHELQGAIELIQNSYTCKSLNNSSLARECKISEVYFRKLFLKRFGISPKQYVIEIRLENAKRLLAEGELSIAQISESCGFSNQYHFSRLFKEREGMTPTEYRRENLIFNI